MYQLNNLRKISGLIHGFSETKDGNMAFNWGEREKVLSNRKKFLGEIGIDGENCIMASLAHDTNIALIDESSRGEEAPEADCLMTKSKNVFLSMLSGDCLPIILFDGVNDTLALAHLSRINTPLGFYAR